MTLTFHLLFKSDHVVSPRGLFLQIFRASQLQGLQALQVSRSVESRQGLTVTSSNTPPPTFLLVLTSFVPFLPQKRVLPLNRVSWHWWWEIMEDSSHSMGFVQDGRASNLQTPSEQGRLKVLKE